MNNLKAKHNLVDKLNFENVLLDTLPNPVYYKDVNGKFIRCNDSFSKLVNSSKENIIGKVAYEFFPKDIADRHKNIDKKIMKTLGKYADEIVFPKYNGEIKYFILNKSVYLNENGSVGGIVCVMNDLTQSIKQKNLLIQQSKFAEMGEMIGSIAHQWNEPLVELSAQIQKLQLFYSLSQMDEKKMTNFVNDSIIQIQYMSDTLYDFRNFLKPSVKKELFDIRKAINDIFEIIGKQIFYFNIKIEIDYESLEEEILFYGYKNELKQVILNIINNAKNKITKLEDNVNKNYIISVSVKKSKKYNIIEIKDNAGPIDEKVINHVFEPFFTTRVDGMGFGLYMSKLIIEDKMQGKIDVENFKNNVVFTIKIPLEGLDDENSIVRG
jgi:PAS domain S-box-containing protein